MDKLLFLYDLCTMIKWLRLNCKNSQISVLCFIIGFRIKNFNSPVPLTSLVTVNSRNEEDDETDGRRRRDIGEDYTQEYGMQAFVNGKSNFTISSKGAHAIIKNITYARTMLML